MFKLIKNLTPQLKITIVSFLLAMFGVRAYLNNDSIDSNPKSSTHFGDSKIDNTQTANSITPEVAEKLSHDIQSGTLIEVSDDFKTTILTESSTLNKPVKDQELLEEQSKLKSQTLSPHEAFYLAQVILDLKSHANLKIYSAYILSLAPDHNLEAIKYVLDQPMRNQPGLVHSPEETLFMQEKAIRTMLQESLKQNSNR